MRKVLAAACAAVLVGSAAIAQGQTFNIYSPRQLDLIEPVLEAFTAATGIETEILFLKKGLVDRVVAEGVGSPADVILTTDIGGLISFVNEGATQVVVSDIINQNIPASFRDDENQWFALTMRGRVIYASVDRLDIDSITYE